MSEKMYHKGFSLLEILIVIAILGVILTIGTVSYSQLRQRSEDARRRTDIEEVRSALEQYKSENNAYPTPDPVLTIGLPFGTDGLDDGSNTYMERMPQDPKYPFRTYYYTSDGIDYTIKTELVNPEPTPCQLMVTPDQCGTGFDCNYCFGSYGQQ